MSQYLFDTDHLTLWDQGHTQVGQRLSQEPPGSVAVSAITVEEYLRGRLASLNRARTGPDRIRQYELLIHSVELFHPWLVVPYDQAAEDQFQQLLTQKVRVGSSDLKIAAVALANNLIVLTRNRRDFGRVPGLTIEDWSM